MQNFLVGVDFIGLPLPTPRDVVLEYTAMSTYSEWSGAAYTVRAHSSIVVPDRATLRKLHQLFIKGQMLFRPRLPEGSIVDILGEISGRKGIYAVHEAQGMIATLKSRRLGYTTKSDTATGEHR